MKKSLIIILFLILLVLPFMSAVEFEMNSNFTQGETLLAKISGNFLDPILKENIFFYRDHVRIPLEYDVVEIQDEFYIFALLDKPAYTNYSLTIKDVRYMVGSQVSDEDITKYFGITDEQADFSVEPGFVVTDKSFFVEVQNLLDSKIIIQIDTTTEGSPQETTQEPPENSSEEDDSIFNLFGNVVLTPEENSITLISGEIKKINVDVSGQAGLIFLKLSTENLVYRIPVYVSVEGEIKKAFRFEPSELGLSSDLNFSNNQTIYLYNTGDESLTNVLISISESLTPYVDLSTNVIDELLPNSSAEVEFSFISDIESIVQGNIKAQTEDGLLTAYSEIFLNFSEGYIPVESDIYITQTCEELNGVFCSENEECTEEIVNSKNGSCCLGSCEEVEEFPIEVLIGIGIIIVVGVLVFFLMKRYKKVKKPVDLLKIAQGKKPEPVKVPVKRNEPMPRPSPQFRRPKHIIRYVEKPIVKERIVEKPVVKEVEKIVEKPIIKEVEKKVFVERPKRPAPPRFKYKASTESQTYHKTSCRLAKLIKQKYKITSNDIRDFEKRGYKPCKICLGKKK